MKKHVLLTGGAGFIGHHCLEHILRNTDWNITVVDRLTYAGDLNRITDIECWPESKGRVKFVYHDFRAPLLTKKIYFAGFGMPNYIIHMGAESHVDRSIDDPIPFVESNVLGTVNMLNFGRAINVEKFIYVSTDEVYGPSVGGHLHIEGEPHRPGNPYAASKAAAEDFCMAYHNTYGVPVIISNTMNNFGERQDTEKFVPKTMRAILKGEPVIIHVKKGNALTQTVSVGPAGVVVSPPDRDVSILDISSRCWLHARNHADGLIFLLQRGTPGERYNITGERKNVKEMAELILNFMGLEKANIQYEDFHSFRPGHDMHYGLDGSRMALMGWRPPYDLETSLQHTVEWTMSHKEWLGL